MTKKPSHPYRGSARRGAPRKSAPDPQAELVTTAAALAEACGSARACGSFAFDTEFVMEDRFAPEICVVQLATPDRVFVIDPYEVGDLAPIWQLVADPDIEVVVHAGMEDLALCKLQGGLTPQRVFDCQVACGLVTTHYPFSLSRMAKHFLDERLHKSQTLTDWRRRPLSAEQVRYAADDVRYLPLVRQKLGERLDAKGRMPWLIEEMARFSTPSTYARAAADNVFRLKGAGSLNGLSLAIARELVKVREELAARYNRPARAVVRDHLVIEIAKHRWTDPADIKTLRGLNLRAQAIEALADAVTRALALPMQEWPTPAPVDDESDEEAAIAMLANAVIRAYCTAHDIAHPLVAAKKEIHAYVRTTMRNETPHAPLPLEIGWREEAVGAVLRDVLAGRRRVGVDRVGKRFVVKIEP